MCDSNLAAQARCQHGSRYSRSDVPVTETVVTVIGTDFWLVMPLEVEQPRLIVVVEGLRQRTEDANIMKAASGLGVEKRILNNLESKLTGYTKQERCTLLHNFQRKKGRIYVKVHACQCPSQK